MDNFICCYNEVIGLLWSILTIEHVAGGSTCPKAWTLVLELINCLGNFEWPWAYHLNSLVFSVLICKMKGVGQMSCNSSSAAVASVHTV